jgi:autotransporter-associated beta strand protein
VSLTADSTIDVVGTSTTLTLSGVLSGTNSITKEGTGTLVLSAANTYSGGTAINTGTLRAGNNAALGTGAATVASGAALDLYGYTISNALSLAGQLSSTVGALTNSSGAGTASGAITLTANTSFGGSHAFTVSGVIAGAFNVTKVGAGTTTFTAGILSINSDRSLGVVPSLDADAIVLNGGALQGAATFTLDSNRGITLTADSGLAATSSFVMSYGGIITGGFNLTINGASQTGTVLLSGANTYTGTTTVSGGTLSISADNNLGVISTLNAAAITLSGGGACDPR